MSIIGSDNLDSLLASVDASFGVWYNMRIHNSSCISMVCWMIHGKSVKQGLNTKGSTEANFLGVSGSLPCNIHLVSFIKENIYEFKINKFYHENDSDIKMERSGRILCTINSWYVNIFYFSVNYNEEKKEIMVEYCPTQLMIANHFTNPIKLEALKMLHDVIMGYFYFDILLTTDLAIKEYFVKGNKIKMIEKSTVLCIEKESWN